MELEAFRSERSAREHVIGPRDGCGEVAHN